MSCTSSLWPKPWVTAKGQPPSSGFPTLRRCGSRWVELVNARQIEDAKRVVKMACELDPDLRLVVLDHPGLSAIW